MLERFLYNQIYQYFERLLPKYQCGFCKVSMWFPNIFPLGMIEKMREDPDNSHNRLLVTLKGYLS